MTTTSMPAAPVSEENPLRAGLRLERMPQPCIMVIYGATGDLTHRKLMPALYNLARERLLPHPFAVVAFARRDYTDDSFRQEMRTWVDQFSRQKPIDEAVWEGFAANIYYHRAEFGDPAGYSGLSARLDSLDRDLGTGGNRLFYLATPPSQYPEVIQRLGEAGLAREGDAASSGERGWSRLIVEKPFGHDLETARELNHTVHRSFREDQVYRIDHYLGKETVQNILVLRFANGIFEPVWNRRYIDHVEITAAETVGVEGRGNYYEEAGTLRDMVQSHLLQLLNLVAMEPPVAFDANAVRDEKVKVLRAIRPLNDPADVAAHTVRGQYGAGWVAGKHLEGYREEKYVSATSTTDTFVALRLFVDNWRWQGVPFYLRTGKALPKRVTEIAVQFRPAPHALFGFAAGSQMEPNVLSIRIQPDEGIALTVSSKVPGAAMTIRPVKLDFLYGASFVAPPPEAYERLILDCMLGDSTHFTRSDAVEQAWSLVTGILTGWAQQPAPTFPNYEAGTWGPREAHQLLQQDGRSWRRV
ncbi:MAG: glucose-6-phosphate dehydrogenase [Chloroflexota bacterium]